MYAITMNKAGTTHPPTHLSLLVHHLQNLVLLEDHPHLHPRTACLPGSECHLRDRPKLLVWHKCELTSGTCVYNRTLTLQGIEY